MRVQVLGTGCAKCKKLFAAVESAAADSQIEVVLEKVESLDEIMKFGVMMTPALVVAGEVKSTGRIPAVQEIRAWLSSTAENKG